MFNCADDNTLSVSSTSLDVVAELLKINTVNTMKWFSDNYIQANPDKFQVMFLNPHRNHVTLPCWVY